MDRNADRHFALYASLTAYSALTRSEASIWFEDGALVPGMWTSWVYAAAALLVLVRPGDLRALLLLFAAEWLDLAWILPASPNHWLLTGLVGAGWWALALQARAQLGRWPTGGELLPAGQPALRAGVALLYLFTGIWKSNADFTNLDHSCGVRSWLRLADQFPILPAGDEAKAAVVWFTLALEHVGPALLLVPAARRFMVPFFVLFHATLALDARQNYQNFSWVMIALLSLYASPSQVAALEARAPALTRLARGAGPFLAVGWVGLLGLAGIGPIAYVALRWTASAVLAWTGVAVSALLFSGPSEEGGAGRGPIRAPLNAAWVFVALVFLNGISPVLGLKNRNSWQMYSNVRLEAEVSNHWYLPPSLDLFGLLRDQAQLLEASDPALVETYVKPGLTVTWWDLRVALASHPDASVTWSRGGEVRSAARVADSPELAPPPLLPRKLVWFRPIGPQVAKECVW